MMQEKISQKKETPEMDILLHGIVLTLPFSSTSSPQINYLLAQQALGSTLDAVSDLHQLGPSQTAEMLKLIRIECFNCSF